MTEAGGGDRAAEGAIRVLLVDDHDDVRRVMQLALERSGEFTVVGESDNGADAIDVAAQLQPDIVILDLMMPGVDGRTALPAILAQSPRSMVVVLSALDAADEAGPVLARGAFAYLEKSEVSGDLAQVVGALYAEFRRALEGETVLAPASTWRPANA